MKGYIVGSMHTAVFTIMVSSSLKFILLMQAGHVGFRRRRTYLNLIDRRIWAMVGKVDQSLS